MTDTNKAASPREELVSLRDCPPGPFLFEGRLGFKTEYMAMEADGPVNIPGDQVRWKMGHSPDVYVMASGECFWGGTKTRDERDALMVTPVEVSLCGDTAFPEEMTPDMRGALELAFLKAKPLASHLAAPKLVGALRAAAILSRPPVKAASPDHVPDARNMVDDAAPSLPVQSVEGEPWMNGHHARHPWAASGDQPERLWVLRFNDPDQAEMSWHGPDAEREAKEAYRRFSPAWTCALLATVPMVEPKPSEAPAMGWKITDEMSGALKALQRLSEHQSLGPLGTRQFRAALAVLVAASTPESAT